MSDFKFSPGAAKLETFKISKHGEVPFNLKDLLIETNVNASIVDPFSVVDFTIMDARNFLAGFPIEAGDKIELTYSLSASVKRDYNVRVIKIDNIVDQENARSYTLYCVSEFVYRSYQYKISKAFTGPVSDIAFAIFEQHSGGDDFGIWEPSVGAQSLIIPYLTPLQAMKWLAKRAKPSFDDVRFRFFQDSKMAFHFTPVEKFVELLKDVIEPMKFTYNIATNHDKDTGLPATENVYKSILDLRFNKIGDLTEKVKNGSLASTMMTIDLNTKTLDVKTYNYFRDFETKKYANDLPLLSPKEDYGSFLLDFNYVQSNQHDDIEMNVLTDISGLKRTNLNNSHSLEIIVKGSDTVDVGQIIEIDIPSMEPKHQNLKDKFDQKWSGKYFVVAKRDKFSNDKHQMSLTLAKDSQINGALLQ